MTIQRLRGLCLLVAVCLGTARAEAHQMPKSTVLLDIRSNQVDAELQIPVDRLQVALRHDPAVQAPAAFITGAAMLDNQRAQVASYILRHVHPATMDGRAWSVQLAGLSLMPVGSGLDLVARLAMRPPAHASVRRFVLGYDVVVRELVTHAALVSVRSDWRSGVRPGSPELVGGIGIRATQLVVDRSAGSGWRGFCSIFRLGVSHIAEGTDHLLFLLTLLLPAPLLVVAGRWAGPERPTRSVLKVAKIVSAFTVGHSLTLALGAVGLLRLPQPPIEFLIATSILVSAIHALRPIVPGREYLVAAGFGLVHGASFAAVLAELGLDPWGMAVGIAGFNLGIEAMQLVVVLVTMPWLILLSTTPLYPLIRIGGAGFAVVAAIGWMIERATNFANPVGPLVDSLASHATTVVVVLAVLSVTAKAVQAAAASRRSTLSPRIQ